MKKRTNNRIRNMLITGFFVMVLAVMGTIPQAAQLLPGSGTDEAYAETTYTVFIYSGKEGYFGEPDTTMKKITGLKYGEQVTVSLSDLGLVVKDPDTYYVRGLKIAGHDNDELSSMQFQSYSFKIEEDTSFSVSYGMAGGMVKYTVNYRDRSGKSLHSSEEFYGMAGDKPVVAFKHIDGYLPDDYNLAKTLSSNEADNVFTFTYHKAEGVAGGEEGEEGDEDTDNGGDNDNNGGNNGANAGNGGNAAGNGTATADIGNNATPLANITDLDDNDTPMASVDKDKDGGLSGAAMGLIGIVIAGILIALGLLYLILRRKGEEGEE